MYFLATSANLTHNTKDTMTKPQTFHGLRVVKETRRTITLAKPAKGLARIRHELGMTSYALASVLAMNRSTWSECENGHRKLTDNQRRNLSAYLHKIGQPELVRELT